MKTRIAAVASSVILAAAALYFWPASPPRDPSRDVGASAARYTLAYSSREARAEGLGGSLELDADLVLAAYDARRVGLTVVACRSIDWRVLEEPVMESAADCERELAGREILLTLDGNRGLSAIDLPPGLTPRAEALLRGIAQELSFEQRTERAWRTDELSPRGRASAHYTREGSRYERTRVRYVEGPEGTLTSTTSLVVAGLLPAELTLHERVDGEAQIEVHMALSRGAEHAIARAPSVDGWTRVVPGAVQTRTSEALLDQRVDGYTRELLLADLDAFGDGGQFPDHQRWFWRATGLLRQHPELAREREPKFLDASATDRRRSLLLDLLASAGTSEAQAALLRLLGSEPATARSDRFALYVQRVGLVPRPVPETLAWIEARHGAATDHNTRFSTAFTLGSVARRFAQSDPSVPRRIAGELTESYERAQDDRERALWLRAIGATGDGSARRVLEGGLGGSPSMRLAAVEGLASIGAAEPLYGAVSDAHPAVQSLALRHVSLDEGGTAALERMVASNGVHARNVETLIRRLAQGEQDHPAEVARIARAMIDHGYATGPSAVALHRLAGA
jgi:hypothetical protein